LWDKKTRKTTQGQVDFRDTNDFTVFFLPRPIATDANGAKLNLTYELKKQGNTLFVILKTNYSWLNATERVYPVSIDPTSRYPNFNVSYQITEAGLYNLSFNISEFKIKDIIVRNANVKEETTKLFELQDKKSSNFMRLYALNVFDAENATMTINATATRLYKCNDWNFVNKICDGYWQKTRNLTPGQEYEITLSGNQGNAYSELGLIAINTHKSIYLENETANISIGVLDTEGNVICDANVTLLITNSNNVTTNLTTMEGNITVSNECSAHNKTYVPDYFANYTVNDTGNYFMNASAVINNFLNPNMASNFEVRNNVSFDVIRSSATRIVLNENYTMNFTIKANENFTGNMTEVVPPDFNITSQNGLIVEKYENYTLLKFNVSFLNGNTYNIGYEYDAPDVSPELFLLGPLRIGNFSEARLWQIASDGWTLDECSLQAPLSDPNINVGGTFTLIIEACQSGASGGFDDVEHTVQFCTGTSCDPTSNIGTTGDLSTPTNPQSCGNACKNACINKTFTVTGNTVGSYVIDGFCDTTNAGNTSTVKQAVTVIDPISPNVSLTAPTNNSINDSRSINFTFNPTTNDNFANCSLWTNETSWSEKQYNTTAITNNTQSGINETFASDGTYLWNIKCYDQNNNANFSKYNYTIRIDTTPPTTTLEYPPAAYFNDTSDPYRINFNCSATDNNGIENISLYLTNSTNTSFILNQSNTSVGGTSVVANWSLNLVDGNYTWNCLTYDSAGNSDWSVNITVLINYSGLPVMASTRISPTTPSDSNDLAGYCNATDNDNDNVGYYWRWYLNDVLNSSGTTISSISMGNISAGVSYSCGVLANGSAYCWGSGGSGELGYGGTAQQNSPIAVNITPNNFSSISAGETHSCGILANGSAYCWGGGNSGELGYGGTANQNSPIAVNITPNNFTSISAGETPGLAGDHSCGILANGSAYCWGSGDNGELGYGGTDQQNSPIAVNMSPNNFTSISAGETHSCGILANGSAYCWGSGGSGELGYGGTANQNSPIAMNMSPNNFTSISAGVSYSCGILANGSAYCWGIGDSGRLGYGGTAQQNSPIAVNITPNNFSSISAGETHSCGILADGSAYCWGGGDNGELGYGGTANQNSPVAVNITPNNFTSISAGVNILGEGHSCGILADGSAYCWGAGSRGRLGYGGTANQNSPIAVKDILFLTGYYAQGVEINVANVSSINTSVGDNWTLSCLANDKSSNSSWLNSTNVTIQEVSNIAPNITLISPTNNSINESRSINFTFNPTTNDNFANCSLWTNETSWDVKQTNITAIINNTQSGLNETFNSDGDFLWNIKCYDLDGNANFSKYNFTVTVDTSAPTVTLNAPVNNTNTTAINISFNFTATDPSGIKNATLYANFSGVFKANETNQTILISGDDALINVTVGIEGYFVWNVLVCDNMSKCGFATNNFTLTVDRTSPVTTLEYPPAAYFNDTSDPYRINFNCSATDNNGIENISLYLTNSTNASFILNQSTNVSGISAVANWSLDLTNGNYTWNCLTYDSAGNNDWGVNRTVLINSSAVANIAPNISFVYASSATPNDGSSKEVYILFNASDGDGFGDINVSTANVTLNFSTTFRNSTNCTLQEGAGTTAKINCTVIIYYFDPDGLWTINVSVKDNSSVIAYNDTTLHTMNVLSAMQISPTSLSFGTSLGTGDSDINATDDPLIVNNTGNQDFTTIQVRGVNLAGLERPSEIVPASNFTVNITDNWNANGTYLVNGTLVTIGGSSVSSGNNSFEQLFFFIDSLNSSLSPQTYDTSLHGIWNVSVS